LGGGNPPIFKIEGDIIIINPNLNFKPLQLTNKPDCAILHHSDKSECTIEDVHEWHLNKDWAGCGYHYFVRKNGNVYAGRPVNAVGAHCPGYNSRSIGICAEGDYTSEKMPSPQKQAIINLIKMLGLKKIYGHGDVYATTCPGANYPLNEIRGVVMGTNVPVNGVKKGLIAFNDGDIASALLLHYRTGYPISLKSYVDLIKDNYDEIHWLGTAGINDGKNNYHCGVDRVDTAKLVI
jgi:hypothetical protein